MAQEITAQHGLHEDHARQQTAGRGDLATPSVIPPPSRVAVRSSSGASSFGLEVFPLQIILKIMQELQDMA